MQTKRCIQVGIALHQIPQPLPIALMNPQHHHPPHAESAAFGEQRRAIGVEVGEVEVGVAVDQLHGSVPVNALLEGPRDGLHARLVFGLFNRSQRQLQRLVGDQLMLLGHGVDRQWQEVEQLRVTEGA